MKKLYNVTAKATGTVSVYAEDKTDAFDKACDKFDEDDDFDYTITGIERDYYEKEGIDPNDPRI